VDTDQARVLAHGGSLPATGAGDGPVAVFGPDGTFLALVQDRGESTRALAVFV
jgi:tRNA pseudouridine55 synthase